MSKQLLAFSFFKEKEIDYFFDKYQMKITFPCFYCEGECRMEAITTNWKCSHCYKAGNLSTIIKMKSLPFSIHQKKVYNPQKSLIKIKNKLTILKSKHPDEIEHFASLEDMISELVVHYQNELKKICNF